MNLTVAHVYPDLLNLYGDSGNVLCIQKRCEWHGIKCTVRNFEAGSQFDFSDCDVVFIGGGQDREQQLVLQCLGAKNARELAEAVENKTVGLVFVAQNITHILRHRSFVRKASAEEVSLCHIRHIYIVVVCAINLHRCGLQQLVDIFLSPRINALSILTHKRYGKLAHPTIEMPAVVSEILGHSVRLRVIQVKRLTMFHNAL